MEYDGRICRAPMERSSYMLPVMAGCSYNRCKFCNLFRDVKYRELSMEQIEADLIRVKEAGGNPRKIFLGDGNAFGLKTPHLMEIIERVHSYFPECSCINMDATVTSIRLKSDEELQLLYDNGVRHLYLGIESGLDDVLAFMHKDHDQTEAREQIARIEKIGYLFDAHIMTGVAGKGRGEENARALAQFLNENHVTNVCNFSMFIHREVELYKDITSGAFEPATELENLREEAILLALLGNDEAHPVNYDGFHDFIEFRVRGVLPRDRVKMIEKVKEEIKKYEGRPDIYSVVHGDCPVLEREGGEKVWSMEDKVS